MTIAADLSSFAFNAAGVNTGGFTMRNKIINGAMQIDQRANGATTTVTADTYVTCDRWKTWSSASSKFSIAQSSTAPAGFNYSLLATSLSAYTVAAGDYFLISQQIEGYNFAEMAWGTSSAKTVTLSFWVRSSLTGTFTGGFENSAADRSYPFTYTISAANTWEQKTITVAGDTTGTWVTNNGVGVYVWFGLGVGSTRQGTPNVWQSGNYPAGVAGATSVVGTNGATFYITGVQLEKGTSATPFEYRNYQQELAMCQRYCYVLTRTTASGGGNYDSFGPGNCWSTAGQFFIQHPVKMRAAPTASFTAASTFGMHCPGASDQTLTSISLSTSSVDSMSVSVGYASALGSWPPGILVVRSSAASATITTSAEL